MCQNSNTSLNDYLQQENHQLEKKLTSKDLLGQAKQILIEHEGCCYCLRLTKQNKLILTK